jgi:hypothetical protein
MSYWQNSHHKSMNFFGTRVKSVKKHRVPAFLLPGYEQRQIINVIDKNTNHGTKKIC